MMTGGLLQQQSDETQSKRMLKLAMTLRNGIWRPAGLGKYVQSIIQRYTANPVSTVVSVLFGLSKYIYFPHDSIMVMLLY